MGAGFQLQAAPLFRGVELVRQSALDVPWRRVVTLDEVRVIAVHDPDRVREAGGRTGMQARAEIAGRARKGGYQVNDFRACVVEQTGLHASRCFEIATHADLVI